jgi:pyridoxal/pyridoxine/pyridoxamine kinase
MATFVMQSLGCEVSAINTVHYSTSQLQAAIFVPAAYGMIKATTLATDR